MQYKSIVLERIRQAPNLRRQLRRKGTMLKTVELYAEELKQKHQGRMDELSRIDPNRDKTQITSEALEMALDDLENCLPPEARRKASEELSLDDAMTFICRHTPPE